MIGETVGHYLIAEKLGGGGMGVVYRAEDERLGRNVALKFLPPELTGDEEARQRFVLEARAASALDHSNICTIHDIGESSDGRLFIAMAYYDGETLKARLARGPIPPEDAIDIARQVAKGLERAHEGGIVHRDIKPANIMITSRGEAKIVDFGIAKLAGAAALTETGSTLGTLSYMSPEQAQADEVGPATDLWSLGVVLYEMLVGELPFGGANLGEVLAAILTRPVAAPGASVEDLNPALDDLVTDLLQKDPSARPVTAGLVAARLEAMQRPAVTAGPGLLRRPAAWVAGLVAVAAVAAAIIVPAQRRARTDEARASLAEIERLANEYRYAEAYSLAAAAEEVLGQDSALHELMPLVSDVINITSDPAGAAVFLQTVDEGPGLEIDPSGITPPASIGATPISKLRVARGGHRLSLELDGHETIERVISSDLARGDIQWDPADGISVDAVLLPTGQVPEGMVHVPAGAYRLVSADAPVGVEVDLGDFFIDRFEVTNAAYRDFVRDPGYASAGLDGRVDRTGLPGPRGWTSQQYPAGTDNHPVTGIGQAEAAAYCVAQGKALPTLWEWEKAARGGAITRRDGFVLPWGAVHSGQSTEFRANFGGTGTTEVDAHPWGISPYGAFDMAGNVREWTANPSEDGFIAMGGSWQDFSYVFAGLGTYDEPFSSPWLGFRCVLRDVEEAAHGGGMVELGRRTPEYEPVDEATYRSYLQYYRYDPLDLEPEVIETTETEDWTRLKVAYRGPDEDPVLAYLFLPRTSEPPFQTVVLVPGLSAFFTEGVEAYAEVTLGPIIRSGRAVFTVVLDGMIERGPPDLPASASVEFRNLMVKHSTELSLGLDYLESRDDIDSERIAYAGLSWGAGSRAVLSAIDDRFRATIYIGGGVDERMHPTVPEALNVNFLPYVDGPKLMVNGRQDEEHPWLTRARPYYELLSEPKELVLEDNEGHLPSPEVLIPAINGFLDREFGPVR